MENRIAKLEEFAADAKIRLTRIEAALDQNGGRFDQDIPTSIVVYAQQPGPTAAANPPVTTPSAPAPRQSGAEHSATWPHRKNGQKKA